MFAVKHMSQVHFRKLFMYKFATGISKKSAPPPQKFREICEIS